MGPDYYPYYFFSWFRYLSFFWFLFFVLIPLALGIYIFNDAPKHGRSQFLALLGFFSFIGLAIYLLTKGEKIDKTEEGGDWFMAHGAKRAYFYLISFISLAVLFFGVADLIRIVLAYDWGGQAIDYGSSVYRSYNYGKDSFVKSVSFRLATVIVSFPLWLFHWLHIGDQLPKVEDSREQKISFKTHRGYLYLVSGLSALLFLIFGIWLLTVILSFLLGARGGGLRELGAPLGYGLASAVVFVFHFQALKSQQLADLEAKLKSVPDEKPAVPKPVLTKPQEKFCAKCGEKASLVDTFCHKCGTKF